MKALIIVAITSIFVLVPTKSQMIHIGEKVQAIEDIKVAETVSVKEFKEFEKVPVSVEEIAYQIALRYGWSGSEWESLKTLWGNESSWNTDAVNPSSGACGIPQAYPCSKIGANWRDPRTQLEWGANYIKERYGKPSAALHFWRHIAPGKAPYTGHWY